MHILTNVAVIGASGNLGPPVVKALLDAGFNVTAVTRQGSRATFPAGVVVKKKSFIDAAIKAQVKRFIPSEFGINIREARNRKFGQFVASKIADVDYLMELSDKHVWFSWTGISTGAFFDSGLQNGFFGFDLKNRSCQIFDSGDEPFPATNLAFIGKCIAASLAKPEDTAYKYLEICSFTTSQNEVRKMIEEEIGSELAVERVQTSDLETVGELKLAKNDPSAFVEYLIQYVFADGAGQAVAENAAVKVLGLQEESLGATVKGAIAATSYMSRRIAAIRKGKNTQTLAPYC